MMSRRSFLAAASALPLGCASGAAGAGGALDWIDTHQHLWDLSKFRLPWLKAGGTIGRDFLPSDYAEAVKGFRLAKAVYMEVDVADDQKAAEADFVVSLCQDPASPTKGAVIGARPADPGFPAYLDRVKGVRWVKGVRQVLVGAKPGTLLAPGFVAALRLLGTRDLVFDLCIAPGQLAEGADLAARCPDTRFVVDHCGNADPKAFVPGTAKPSHDPDEWKRGIDALAARPNTIIKISGIVARVPKEPWSASLLAPVIDHCLDAFGPDRAVFGSDWPVCLNGAPLQDWVDALASVLSRRPIDVQRKVAHDTAARFYRLG
jgi:L-fuconolactonase